MTLLLVRHAHAGSRKDWPDDDRQRPLSSKGLAQAQALAGQLAQFGPDRVLSSPFRRCVETMEPLAKDLGLTIEEVDELGEGAGGAAVALVRSLVDAHAALCTHGDVIPGILVALADEDRLDLGPAPRQAKGSAWVLETEAGRFFKATYLPPQR